MKRVPQLEWLKGICNFCHFIDFTKKTKRKNSNAVQFIKIHNIVSVTIVRKRIFQADPD